MGVGVAVLVGVRVGVAVVIGRRFGVIASVTVSNGWTVGVGPGTFEKKNWLNAAISGAAADWVAIAK